MNVPAEVLQYVRERMAEDGTELTPAETAFLVEDSVRKIRAYLRSRGIPESQIPSDDVKLIVKVMENC